MSTTFSLYKPVTTPPCFTHAIHARLLSPTSTDLVCVSAAHLSLFTLSDAAFERGHESTLRSCTAQGGLTDQHTLVRKYETPVFGMVEGISAVRLPGWNRDALLLAYPHSKLSLCAWDPSAYELVTLCIWTQDEEVVEKERERERQKALHAAAAATAPPPKQLAQSFLSQVKKYIPPMLRTDPENRCAALLSFDAFLNIFDLSSKAALPKSEPLAAGTKPCQTGITVSKTGSSSFYAHAASVFSSLAGVGSIPSLSTPATYSLSSLGLGTITDMQFLHGFQDPTLLILHEKRRTWEGRYAVARLTQELTCVTFHPSLGTFSLIGSLPGVAHDTFALYPIPMPLGGALLFSQNAIAHWNNNAVDYALATNEVGLNFPAVDKLTHFDSSSAQGGGAVLRLDLSSAVFLSTYSDKATMFVAAQAGEAYLLHLYPSGASMRSMQLEALGFIPTPKGVVRLPNPASVGSHLMNTFSSSSPHNVSQASLSSFLFLYSKMGPSMLLEYRRAKEEDRAAEAEEEREEERAVMEERRVIAAAEMAARKKEAEAKAAAAGLPTGAAPTDGAASTSAPMDSDLKPIPSLASALEAAATPAAAASSTSKADDDDESLERAPKRSRLGELYTEMTGDDATNLDDELIDVFGFGRAGEVAEAELVKPTPMEPLEDEAKQVELMQTRAAADRETLRQDRLLRSFRARKELLFFVVDRLACGAPAADLTLSYALPRSEEEGREELEFEQALADEAAKRREIDMPKPSSEEEERVAAEKERKDMEELEKQWREKERKSRVLEMIQLSGVGPSGSVLLSTEGLLPDVVTAVPLQRKCIGCWTVKQSSAATKSKKRRSTNTAAGDDSFHAFLLISTPTSTIVIQTGSELQELTSGHAFFTGRTIYAANIYASPSPSSAAADEESSVEGIVQVTRQSVRLIQGGALVKEWTAPSSLHIDAAQVESPYILLRMSDASLRIIETSASSSAKLSLSSAHSPSLQQSPSPHAEITTAYLFRDATQQRALKNLAGVKRENAASASSFSNANDGAAAMEVDEIDAAFASTSSSSSSSKPTPAQASSAAVDEMDDLERLLGGGDASMAPPAASTASASASSTVTAAAAAPAAPILPPDHYLVVARGANLEFYSLPDYVLVYTITRFPLGKRILQNSDLASSYAEDEAAEQQAANGGEDAYVDPLSFPLSARNLPPIVDLFVDTVSDSDPSPCLFAFLDNGDLLAYQSFVAPGEGAQTSAAKQLKWVRVETPSTVPISRPFLNMNKAASVVAGAVGSGANGAQGGETATNKAYRDAFGLGREPKSKRKRLVAPTRFQKLSHLSSPPSSSAVKSGLLVCGTKPLFFCLERGYFRPHPFVVDARPRAEEVAALGSNPLAEEEDMEPDAEDESTALLGEESKEGEPAMNGSAAGEEVSDELLPDPRRKAGLVSCSPFHNPNCRGGMIYFDTHGTLHLANLPAAAKLPRHPLFLSERKREKMGLQAPLVELLKTGVASSSLSPSISLSLNSYDYDSALLTRSIHLGATPVFITKHIPTSTIAIVFAHPQRMPSQEMETDFSLPVYRSKYELVVFSAVSWEVLARYGEFELNEMVLSMSAVRMNKKMYIVLGTSEYKNEEHSTRGRIILVDLFYSIGNSSEVDSATGEFSQVKLLKMKVNTQAEKLPVSHVTQLAHNTLVTAQGSKIILYKHTGRQLAGIAFFDCQLFISSIQCLNNFILYGDVKRGIHLLYWDPVLRTLTQLGMSNESFHSLCVDFLVDHRQLNFVTSDQEGNVQLFKFAPNTPSAAASKIQLASYENPQVAHHPLSTQTLKESLYTGTSLLGGSGYKLNLKNDFHVGERIGKMAKLKMRTRQTNNLVGGTGGASGALAMGMEERFRNSMNAAAGGGSSPNKLARQLSANSAVASSAASNRPIQSYLLMASYSGSYSQLLPIDQLIFRRLSTLVMQMTLSRKQVGGMNPLSFRLFQANGPHHPHLAKKLLDATLLFQYPSLDAEEQWRLAKQIGTTPAQIVENLKWIAWATQMH